MERFKTAVEVDAQLTRLYEEKEALNKLLETPVAKIDEQYDAFRAGRLSFSGRSVTLSEGVIKTAIESQICEVNTKIDLLEHRFHAL